MATKQRFTLPENFAVQSSLGLPSGRAPRTGQCAEMRTLLEKAREAQATRIATEPSADLSRIEIADLMKAIGRG